MFLVEPSLDFSVQPQCSQCLCGGISGGETQPPRHRGHGGCTEKQQIWINLGLNHVFSDLCELRLSVAQTVGPAISTRRLIGVICRFRRLTTVRETEK